MTLRRETIVPIQANLDVRGRGDSGTFVIDRTDRELWAEVGIILLALLLPTYYSLLVDLIYPTSGLPSLDEHSSVTALFQSSLKDISGSALVLYIIWRSGEPWSQFGFSRFGWTGLDTSIAVVVVLTSLGIEELIALFEPVHIEDSSETDTIKSTETALLVLEYVAFAIHICIAAFYEELLMRGYLIPRFEHLLRSTWVSLSLTALLFGSLHMDQGPGGVLSTTLAGLVYGGAFCWFRRLWPVVGAHIIYNLMVMLVPRLMDTFVT